MSKILRDNIEGITNPAIRRLGYVAGIKQMGGSLYDEIRAILRVHLDQLLHRAITYTIHKKRKTVGEAMVSAALEKTGYTSDIKGKKCQLRKRPKKPKDIQPPNDTKAGHGMKALREIRWHQKHSDCLNIPMESFSRLVRELSQAYKNDLRFSANAMLLIQYSCENYLIELLKDSNLCALHSDRIGVKPKDVQLARRIRGERA